MGNFLKAEILEKKDRYKTVITLTLITNIIFWLMAVTTSKSIFKQILNNSDNISLSGFGLVSAFLSMPLILLFAVIIGGYSLYIIVDDYKSDFFTDKSYLKFSQPITTGEYLCGKILSITGWSLIVFFIGLIISVIGVSIIGYFMSQTQPSVLGLIVTKLTEPGALLYWAIVFGGNLISGFMSLMLLYFSITFVKTYMPNSKKGNAWIMVYIIGSSIISFFVPYIRKFIPYIMELNEKLGLVIHKMPSPSAMGNLNVNIKGTVDMLFVSDIIYELAIGIILFIAIYYLIENKLEVR